MAENVEALATLIPLGGALAALLVLSNDLLFISQNVAGEVLVLRLLAGVVAVQELLRLLADHRFPAVNH